MTVFAGHYGSIEFKRVGSSKPISCTIGPSDLDVLRNRVSLGVENGLDLPIGTIVTGDRLRLTTSDARGLPFRFYESIANTTYIDNPGAGVLPLEFYVNVDRMGAFRMYRNFADALANPGSRYSAIPLAKPSTSVPWDVSLQLLPGSYTTLGEVQGFTLSTDRESVDVTALGNKYKTFESSAISGSGSVDCLFNFKSLDGEELPLALAQLIQKVEVGSGFAGRFYILEPGPPQPFGYGASDGVYYEVNGILTRSAFTMRADQIAECSFDFITSGEFILTAGVGPVDLTTENNVRIGNESTLEELGVLLEVN
jgi:hypothetical protein